MKAPGPATIAVAGNGQPLPPRKLLRAVVARLLGRPPKPAEIEATGHGSGSTADPRPLTGREREILDFLLSGVAPGVAELREQAKTALAQPWDCGCASFEIVVDRENTSPSLLRPKGPAIDANANESAPERLVCLMLWVDEEGWLSSLEVVDVADDHAEFNPIPPPSMYEPPKVQQ